MSVVTPRTCARGKAISLSHLSSVVVTKIIRSPHLGIWVTRKYKKSVEIGKKNLHLLYYDSNQLIRPMSVMNTVFLVAPPIDSRPCSLYSCVQVQSSILVKICHFTRILELEAQLRRCAVYARGMCSREL